MSLHVLLLDMGSNINVYFDSQLTLVQHLTTSRSYIEHSLDQLTTVALTATWLPHDHLLTIS